MTEPITFFGFGAFADKKFMEALLGRVIEEDQDYTLHGYELCVQTMNDIPEKSRETLETVWGHSFSSYAIKPGPNKVKGKLWHITEDELRTIRMLEMVPSWKQEAQLRTEVNGLPLTLTIEILGFGQSYSKVIEDSEHYSQHLNNKEKMYHVANEVRNLVQSVKEGNIETQKKEGIETLLQYRDPEIIGIA